MTLVTPPKHEPTKAELRAAVERTSTSGSCWYRWEGPAVAGKHVCALSTTHVLRGEPHTCTHGDATEPVEPAERLRAILSLLYAPNLGTRDGLLCALAALEEFRQMDNRTDGSPTVREVLLALLPQGWRNR